MKNLSISTHKYCWNKYSEYYCILLTAIIIKIDNMLSVIVSTHRVMNCLTPNKFRLC